MALLRRAIAYIRLSPSKVLGWMCMCVIRRANARTISPTRLASLHKAGSSSNTAHTLSKYDVFINHRGPDVRKGFVAHLNDELIQAGFHPFLDAESVAQGCHVDESTDDALSGAYVHVAIFSKHYAENKNCLNELCAILKKGKVILPVFYDVKPENLQMPHSGPFAHGFRKHFRRGRHKEIKRWEQALQEVADYKGFDRQDSGDDNLLKRRIVEFIEKGLRRSKVMQTVPENMLGKYDWAHNYQFPSKGRGILSFVAQGSRGVHVAISPRPETTDPMYEIVIGHCENRVSVIRRSSQGQHVCSVPTGLSEAGAVNQSWVSIDEKTRMIKVGRGSRPFESTFCSYMDPAYLFDAKYVCFTSWDVPIDYSHIELTDFPEPGEREETI